MLASPLLLGLVLLIDPWAKTVDFSGGVAVELRGGYAPLQSGGDPSPTARISIVPTATIQYGDRIRNRQLLFEYSPQMFMVMSQQYFAATTVRRPLFFHQVRGRYSGDFNTRWSWVGTAAGTIGESDYSLQASRLGTDGSGGGDGSQGTGDGDVVVDSEGNIQGSIPTAPILVTGGASAGVGFTGRLSPLHSLTIQPGVTIRRLIRTPVEDGGGTSYNQTSANLGISHGYTASAVDSIFTTFGGGYADFGDNGSQAFASTDVRWLRRLRPRLDNQLALGVFFTQQVRARATDSVEPTGLPVLPTVDYLLSGRVLQRSRLRIATTFNMGTQAYFDAVQGSVLPLVGGGFGVNFAMPPDVTAGVTASFYTPPTAPSEAEADNPAAGRTAIGFATPVTYQLSRSLSLEFGTIFTGRGPHLASAGSNPFPQFEFWTYVAFRSFFTT